MSSGPVRALLAVEPGVEAEQVQASLPADAEFNVVGMVSGADEALHWLRDTPADMLLVACAGYSDRALLLLDAVARQNPELSIVVLGHGSPNGFLRRAFEAGADDIIMLPATRDQVRFELQKLLARKQGAETPSSPDTSHLVCVLGPKGGTGKTLTATNLAVAFAQRGSRVALDRPRPPVRRRRPVPRPAAGEDGLRPGPVAGRARLRQARRVPRDALRRGSAR